MSVLCIQEQYIFFYDAFLESVTCGHTEISGKLRLEIQKLNKMNPEDHTTLLQSQFKAVAEEAIFHWSGKFQRTCSYIHF